MKILILAGGYGTRLYPVIRNTPKALLEIAGKTLIDHTIDKFVGIADIEEVVVVTNARFTSMMTDWSKTRDNKPFPVRIVNDGTHSPEERLGAMGDVLFVLDKENAPSDWIIAGSDNLYNFDIDSFVGFSQRAAPGVCVGCYDLGNLAGASKYGVITLDARGKIISLEEKPDKPQSSLISMCLYYYPVESLALIQQFIDETHNTDTTGGYIQWLYKKQLVYGFKFSGKWYDIGSIESYNEAQSQFLE